jgi:hypothetical protein
VRHKYLVAAIVGIAMTASSVFADDHVTATPSTGAFSWASTSLALRAEEPAKTGETRRFRRRHRPWPLPILYGSSAFLHSYDAYLTLSALEAGASEANPIMEPITRSPVAFVAVKAGLTAASIISAEQLWKQRRRKSAVVVMVLSNAMMVAIAAHNTAVVQRIK